MYPNSSQKSYFYSCIGREAMVPVPLSPLKPKLCCSQDTQGAQREHINAVRGSRLAGNQMRLSRLSPLHLYLEDVQGQLTLLCVLIEPVQYHLTLKLQAQLQSQSSTSFVSKGSYNNSTRAAGENSQPYCSYCYDFRRLQSYSNDQHGADAVPCRTWTVQHGVGSCDRCSSLLQNNESPQSHYRICYQVGYASRINWRV